MRVPATHNVTNSRTLKQRCQEISHVHDIVSAGEGIHLILENKIKWLSDEEKQHVLLVEPGIAIHIKVSAEQGLAIKAGLAIPWHKLRHFQRSASYMHMPQHYKNNSIVTYL